MASITLHRKQFFKIGLPYWICINGQNIGIMRTPIVTVQIPEGTYQLAVKFILPIWKWQFTLSGDRIVYANGDTHLYIVDKERWWNLLFDIDLIFCIASIFFSLPHPWNIVYHVISDGFFALWLLRIWLIRKRYYLIKTSNQ